MLIRKREKAIIIETEYFTVEIPKIRPVELDEKHFTEYLGSFYNEKSNQQLQIIVKEGKLNFKLQIGEQQVRPIFPDVFTNSFLQLKFHKRNNEISFFSLNSTGAREIIYKKK